jgi:hypothetical protein
MTTARYNTNENKNNKKKDTFYACTINLTYICFTVEETQLLNKGLKYNLHHRHKDWIKTLATEADTAICQLDTKEQEYMRQLVANNIKKIINTENTKTNRRQTTLQKREVQEQKLIRNIKKKLNDKQLFITKADKGNTIVILHKETYNNKVIKFLSQNNFTKIAA